MRLHRLPYLLLCGGLLAGLAGALAVRSILARHAMPRQALARPVTVRLATVGDTLVHLPEVQAAWDPVRRVHDFQPMFAPLRPLLARADLATAVLETTLGGPASGYTGYPRFNSPDQIADALQWAGVDVIFTAHNHLLDRGSAGLTRTLAYLDHLGLAHVGAAATPDPASRIVYQDVKGIRIAFLAYATSTNGLPLPADRPWAVNLYDPGRVAGDVARARRAGAEIVVCAIHAGVEYQRSPAPEQRAMVDRLLAAGVDVVLGSHPHVIGPVELRQAAGRTAFVAYSLGNLLSNQRWRYSDCGLLALITLVKEPGKPARLAGAAWEALWVHKYRENGRSRYRILPVRGGAAAYARDALLTAADRRRLDEVRDETRALLGSPVLLPQVGE